LEEVDCSDEGSEPVAVVAVVVAAISELAGAGAGAAAAAVAVAAAAFAVAFREVAAAAAVDAVAETAVRGNGSMGGSNEIGRGREEAGGGGKWETRREEGAAKAAAEAGSAESVVESAELWEERPRARRAYKNWFRIRRARTIISLQNSTTVVGVR
jgi:hypothetical protein